VDALAAGDGARLDGAVTMALTKARDRDGAVDRGVQGDGENHREPPSRSALSRLLRTLSSCILRLSSGVRCCGACRPFRRGPGLAVAGSLDPCPRLISSSPTSITIATSP